jgi:putative transposase
LICSEEREQALALLDEALASGSRLEPACAMLDISMRTVQRWRRQGLQDKRKGSRARPANQLSEAERKQILQILTQPQFSDMSPNQIVPVLADRGDYVASESTFYRILRSEQMNSHRQRSKPVRTHGPRAHEAHGPNQVWTWDITYLPSTLRGVFFYLYLIVDIYSRKIIAWQVHDQENAEYAAELVSEGCYVEGIAREQLVLHSDNGSPMKGATMLATLQALGVIPSFSRPSVSDDNAFSEALFRTLKYRPAYPEKPFADLADARAWVETFVQWYNYAHRHSGIRYVTPIERHEQRDAQILAQRHRVYQSAKQRHPQRWSGKTRNWQSIGKVLLNPPKAKLTVQDKIKEAA